MSDEEFMPRFLEWRNIETPCKRCSGAGSYGYGNTATWMGGIGGSMVTWGVCNLCWGSGDSSNQWLNLKQDAQNKHDMATLIRRLLSKIPAINVELIDQVLEDKRQ